jgi:type I restriction enzyme S subunit
MSFSRYDSYKESAVEWLGEVPAHWAVVPFKQVIRRIESGTSVNAVDTPAAEGERGVLKTSCVYSGEFNSAENKAVLPEEYDRASCPLRVGTLIVSRMNTPDLVGAAGLVRTEAEELYLPDRLWQLHLKNCEPAFVHFWTATAAYRSQVQMACSGTSSSMQNLAQDQLRTFYFPNPPRREQAAIVRFLDRETQKIDGLVKEQCRLIKLLKEKRQALISHAIINGLDPSASMKNSHVEWLGDVPEHWEVRQLKSIVTLAGRIGFRGYTTADLVEEGHGAVTLSPSNLIDGGVSFEKCSYLSWAKFHESPEIKVEPLDIVMVKTGSSFGKVGMVADTLPQPATINPQLVLLKNCKFNSRFLFFSLLAHHVQAEIAVSNTGGTIPTMTQEFIGGIRVPMPPLKEQAAIVTRLEKETGKLDALMVEAENAVLLLEERRAAIISAAVTGKIDVRGPVEAEAPISDVIAA